MSDISDGFVKDIIDIFPDMQCQLATEIIEGCNKIAKLFVDNDLPGYTGALFCLRRIVCPVLMSIYTSSVKKEKDDDIVFKGFIYKFLATLGDELQALRSDSEEIDSDDVFKKALEKMNTTIQ